MKKIILNISLVALVLSMTTIGCKKVPDGTLSSYARYEVTPIEIKQGRAGMSDAMNPDGSAKPFFIKMLAVYNSETGENVTETFTKKYPVTVWTRFYDPRKDTTMAMIDAKRKDSLVYPISFNESSGQLQYNIATDSLPLGMYDFDLEIKNSAGSGVYPKIGQFQLIEAGDFEIPAGRSTVAMKVGAETTTKPMPAGSVEVTKINEDVNKVIVRIVDKNGVSFNPKAGEIGRRPVSGTGGGWLQTMQDYSVSTVLFDDRMEFVYGTLAFPLSSLGNGFNYYYRIPTRFVKYDASLGIPDDQYSCNARFSLRVYRPGTYEVKVIVDGVTKK